jgi:hypothetical protein
MTRRFRCPLSRSGSGRTNARFPLVRESSRSRMRFHSEKVCVFFGLAVWLPTRLLMTNARKRSPRNGPILNQDGAGRSGKRSASIKRLPISLTRNGWLIAQGNYRPYSICLTKVGRELLSVTCASLHGEAPRETLDYAAGFWASTADRCSQNAAPARALCRSSPQAAGRGV